LLLYYIRTIPSLCHSIVLLLKYTQGWFKVLHYRFLYRRRCFLRPCFLHSSDCRHTTTYKQSYSLWIVVCSLFDYTPQSVLLFDYIIPLAHRCLSPTPSIVLLLKCTQGRFKVLHFFFLSRRRCFLHSFTIATAVFSILLTVGTLLCTCSPTVGTLLHTSSRTHSILLFNLFLITFHSPFFFLSILTLSHTGASRRLQSAWSASLLAGDCVAVILY
jgi:hypothetical protein